MNNLTIFDFLYQEFKSDKKIRLIELFAGYGSQNLALKYLGANYEHYKICEWATKSIQAYNDLHIQDYTDYSKNISKDEVISYLFNKGISLDYNKPMNLQEIKRKGESWQRQVYNNIIATNNLVNIQQVKGSDLEIVDTNKYDYLMTYSFPCITKDSMILTEKGYIPFEDVEVGMKVLTKGNTWERVVKKFENGYHQTYYLNAMGFENIHCTLNHKFYVREMYRKGHKNIRCFKEPVFKEVKDITKKDYFGIPVINEEDFFYTNDLDFWFMLGMYVGDGWLSKSSNDIIISCNDKKLHLLKSKLDINKYKYTVNKTRTCYKLRFANKSIYEFINKYIGTGSYKKHIPIEIIKMPMEQLNAFYEGYLNSDGCVIDNKHQFSSINRNLIYSFSLIINKLFKRPTCIYKIKVKNKKQIENRVVNQKDWYQLKFKITNDKQDKAFYDNGYIWYPFKSLEKSDMEYVYNMEVENDHSYIINGCISKNCQDLSLAGKQKGMADTSTRSGMLWEVERILDECYKLGSLPQILLMENVTQVVGTKNIKHFQKWRKKLEDLGYQSYIQNMIATEYGIPQTRDRTFMLSVLGEYNYTFPNKMPLKYRLKNLLENGVDESYYLTSKQIKDIQKWESQQNPFETLGKEICPTLTTRSGAYAAGMVLTTNGDVNQEKKIKKILIPEATKKGYAEAYEGDGVYIDRPHQKRGVVQKGMIQTLKTSGNDVGVVVGTYQYSKSDKFMQGKDRLRLGKDVIDTLQARPKEGIAIQGNLKQQLCNSLIENGLVQENDVIRHSYSNSRMENWDKRNVEFNNLVPTLDTRCDCLGVVVKKDTENYIEWQEKGKLESDCRAWKQDKVISTITTDGKSKVLQNDLRIRKLTPREVFRLMGVKDEDFENIAKNQSNSSLYHLAGDSIVTSVLMAIFGKLLGIDYETKINELLKELVNEDRLP